MKKLTIALAVTFVVATSYISTSGLNTVAETSAEADTVAAPAKVHFTTLETPEVKSVAEMLYDRLDFNGMNALSFEVLDNALTGFQNLKNAGKISESSHLLTVCDFSLSSNQKRMWVIDTQTGEILFNSLVAHGKNTGEEFATKFSNIESSYQSSMGFYVTDVTYHGENGYSLKLHGMDRGFNDRALSRAIVMHGADYVSEEFAAQHKRIGRSWGCPAVPRDLAEPIINTIKGQSVLFIYYPDRNYLESSEWL